MMKYILFFVMIIGFYSFQVKSKSKKVIDKVNNFNMLISKWKSKEDKLSEIKFDKVFYYDIYQGEQLSKLKFGLYNTPKDIYTFKIDSNGQ